MFKNTKLSTKIWGLAFLLIGLSCIISVIGYNSLSRVVSRVDKADSVNRIVKDILNIRQQEKNFIIRKNKEYIDKVMSFVSDLNNQIKDTKSIFTQKNNKDQMDQIVGQVDSYVDAFQNYIEMEKSKNMAMTQMRAQAKNVLLKLEEIRSQQKKQFFFIFDENDKIAEEKINQASDDIVYLKEQLKQIQINTREKIEDKLHKADDANRMIKWFLDARKNEKEYIISQDQKYYTLVDNKIKEILSLASDLRSRFNQDINIKQVEYVIDAINLYNESFNKFVGLMESQNNADTAMVNSARQAQKVCNEARQDQKEKMSAQIQHSKVYMFIGSLLAILFGVICSFLIIRTITKAINHVIRGLNEGASQVAAASNEVSSASQQLAEGASEQAASIEETSSSLEETSSMTKQNANNAGEADTLMREANEVVQRANKSMEQLTISMEEISQASDETSKIIKTIDEIAFQTNLLALNAAVEAARAGEAGAGFAVVADEVRNLAMRAADAAKNTASLIEGTIIKVKEGSELVHNTNDAFSEVTSNSVKVGELINEIAAASKDQAQGIDQINQAVADMDKVTQQNAANAEESASASEQMNAQAEQMKNFVNDLVRLISGASHISQDQNIILGSKTGPKTVNPVYPAVETKTQRNKITYNKQKEVKPEQVIPFDEDFEDF